VEAAEEKVERLSKDIQSLSSREKLEVQVSTFSSCWLEATLLDDCFADLINMHLTSYNV